MRVATDKKDSEKCRGFGFVEFEAFDRMQTCLKLYHHSSFDDGKSPARKINVELTSVPPFPLFLTQYRKTADDGTEPAEAENHKRVAQN